MPLAHLCSRSFESRTRSRGNSYYYGGCVQIVDQHGSGVTAVVEGTRPDPYEVDIDWSQAALGEIEAHCSCPHYDDGFLCKHIWATLLAVDAQGLADDVPRRARFDVCHELDLDDEPLADDDVASVLETLEQRMGATAGPDSFSRLRRQSTSTWKRKLTDLLRVKPDDGSDPLDGWNQITDRRREAWYVLNVGVSLQRGKLLVDLFQRETRKNGEFGKIKRLSLRRGDADSMPDAEDQVLLQMLLGNDAQNDASYNSHYYSSSYYDYQTYSRSAIIPGMYDLLLPRLCATGRFVWQLDDTLPPEEGHPVVWDDGEPWQFRLRIESDASHGCWQIDGQLWRGEHTKRLGDAVLLLASGLVLFSDSLARLDARAEFAWISALRKHGAIEVPYADRNELLESLWSAPNLPAFELPDDLRIDQVRLEPRGRLSIRSPDRVGNSNQLHADISYVYDDQVVPVQERRAAFVDAEHDRVLLRWPERERELLGQLADMGLRPLAYYYRNRADLQLSKRALPEVVDKLTAQGWIVESEGRLIRRPGAVSLSVTSDVDWFELDGAVDFDGVTASLPSLLAALRNKEKYILLDDGTHGMLPEEWLRRYGGLVELGEQDDGKLKFAPSQALLLDALLAAQDDSQVDGGFEKFRGKLRSFEGVDPRKEPRGFSGRLRGYQQEGLGWLDFLRDFRFGGCLADDMGLGKTVQVLALLQSRRIRRMPKDQQRKPSIVVVPKSLVFNWIDEAARFTPRLRVLDYTGTGRIALLEKLDDYDVMVTTYGTLRRDIVELKDVPFDYAILDESQAIKNANSQAAKACRLLQAENRLAMTGTPVENHLGELWSLFEFLNPGMLGRSTAFNALMKKGRNGNADDTALPLLAKTLRPFLLRRTKEQVLTELPEKTEQTLHCELGARQRKLYEELRDYYRASLSKRVEELGINKAKIHVLEALLRLRQAACHPGLIDEKRAGESSAKLDMLLEQIEEVMDEGHKALIFSQFTSLLSIVRKRFDKQKVVYEYLDGQTRRRGQRVKRFQEDPNCPLFLISLKAGGHGLNLTAADYVFILDPWWNPAVEAQAVDRAHRIGQTRHVFAYRLICRNTVEDKIIELQRSKRDLAEAIVSADNSLIRNLTTEDLQMLLS